MDSLNAYSPSNTYTLATIFSLYWPSSLCPRIALDDIPLVLIIQRTPLWYPYCPLKLRQLLQLRLGCSQQRYDLPSFLINELSLRFARYGNLHWQRRNERLVRNQLVVAICNFFF
jgi:hypothetical protein